MTSKEVKQIVDENIGKLFWALLPKIPSMVGDDYLEYTINESVVKIRWRKKYKLDCETPLPDKLTDKPFDNIKDNLYRFSAISFGGFMFYGYPDAEKNPIVEGITLLKLRMECLWSQNCLEQRQLKLKSLLKKHIVTILCTV